MTINHFHISINNEYLAVCSHDLNPLTKASHSALFKLDIVFSQQKRFLQDHRHCQHPLSEVFFISQTLDILRHA